MPPVVINRALGLFTHPNKLALPPGAQVIARNCVSLREGVTSRRRGFNFAGTVLTNPPSVLSEFLGRLLVLDGTTLKYDSDGSLTLLPWTGSFTAPADVRMRFLETSGNVYFTTSRGVFVNDTLAGVPVRSGTPAGLDITLALSGIGDSWMSLGFKVGYRVTWSHTDTNRNIKQGTPARQEIIFNVKTADLAWSRTTTTVTITHTAHGFANGDVVEILDSSDATGLPNDSYTIANVMADTYDVTVPDAGGASGTASDGKIQDVTLTFTVPDDIVAGDTWKIWRTDLTLLTIPAVGDDHRLILEGKVSAGEIAAGVVTTTDTNDPSFLGEDLYTNAGVETRDQGNDRPPLAKFIVHFEGHTFYFRAAQPHELELRLLDIAGLVDDTSSLTITSGATTLTYIFSSAENIGARKFKRWTTELTLAQNLEKTVKSLERVINRDTGNTLIEAYYNSGEDDPPGKLRLEKKTLGTSLFTIIVDASGTGDNFTPVLPTSGTTISSFDNAKPNGYWRSKSQQPESVPKLNSGLLGRSNRDILGAVALKEAILVWKEDGLFTISGQSDGGSGASFVQDDLDPNAILDGRGTLVVLDNAAFAHTLQGVLRAGQGQPIIHSRPQIETELRRIAEIPSFTALAHAIPYETDREYIFFTALESTDTTATGAYVYNYASNAWTTWDKPVSCGHVLSRDNKLYLGHARESRIMQERKSYSVNGDDFVDEDVPVTITAVGTVNHPRIKIPGTRTPLVVSQVTLTYSYAEELLAGFLLSQGDEAEQIDLVEGLGGGSYRVTLRDISENWETGAATVGLAIPMEVEWAPVTGGDAAVMKHFPFGTIYPETGGGTHRMGFRADTQSAFDFVDDFIVERVSGFGLTPFGETGWGDEEDDAIETLRTWIPRSHQRCRALSVRYQNNYAREPVDLLSVGLDMRPYSTHNERRPR